MEDLEDGIGRHRCDGVDDVTISDCHNDCAGIDHHASRSDSAYVGHVLGHMPWHVLPELLDELATVLSYKAEVKFVRPDDLRAIEGCRRGGNNVRRNAGNP